MTAAARQSYANVCVLKCAARSQFWATKHYAINARHRRATCERDKTPLPQHARTAPIQSGPLLHMRKYPNRLDFPLHSSTQHTMQFCRRGRMHRDAFDRTHTAMRMHCAHICRTHKTLIHYLCADGRWRPRVSGGWLREMHSDAGHNNNNEDV